MRLPRERLRSRAAKTRGLLLVTDCTSRSMISSEVSLGEPEPGDSSGGALEAPTAVGIGELLWTRPERDQIGRSGQGGPKAKSISPGGPGSHLCCGGCVWCLQAYWSADSSCWRDYLHHPGLAHCPQPLGQIGCWGLPQPLLRTSLSGEGKMMSWEPGKETMGMAVKTWEGHAPQ